MLAEVHIIGVWMVHQSGEWATVRTYFEGTGLGLPNTQEKESDITHLLETVHERFVKRPYRSALLENDPVQQTAVQPWYLAKEQDTGRLINYSSSLLP